MRPITFSGVNRKLEAPGCVDLPTQFDGKSHASMWHLTARDVRMVNESKAIVLRLHSRLHPPVSLEPALAHGVNDDPVSVLAEVLLQVMERDVPVEKLSREDALKWAQIIASQTVLTAENMRKHALGEPT